MGWMGLAGGGDEGEGEGGEEGELWTPKAGGGGAGDGEGGEEGDHVPAWSGQTPPCCMPGNESGM